MSQFSTNEAVSLEKTIDLSSGLTVTKLEDLEDVYEINRTAQWIKDNNLKKVCLQFPDFMLGDSTEVAMKLQGILGDTVYILGDTAYESCCIDYIAAEHVKADAIVHYGPICFSKTAAKIPFLNIYEKRELGDLINAFNGFECEQDLTAVIVDTPFIKNMEKIRKIVEKPVFSIVDDFDITGKNILLIGDNDRKIMNIVQCYQPKTLYVYKPDKKIIKFEVDQKILKRRYFLSEKIKDSNTVGIVIGTLAVKNYLKIIERLKKLISLSGKKYYMISVGKPTVAKLANFPEVDVYVIVTCSMNEIYDSRDYYKPIVTPYDVEIALNINSKALSFSYDFNSFLNDSNLEGLAVAQEDDVSLLTGNLRKNKTDDEKLEENLSLVERNVGQIVENNFLASRSWRGLEQNLGQSEVKLAEEGRRGIAQGYKNEDFK